MITIKSSEEIKTMAEAGKILSRIMQKLKEIIKADISTMDIDAAALAMMKKEGVRPAFKNYRGFPANICISLNEEIVHGIPDEKRILKKGDILSIDVGIVFKDFFSDTAITVAVEKTDTRKIKLINITREALSRGIKKAQVDNYISDISHAIQQYVETNGFSVVREFVGHGIGRDMHEEPQIPNYGQPHCGIVIKEGMVLAIEPMVNMGSWEAEILDNGWTAVTKDRLPSAHFEHTVAITETGPQVLTI